MMNIKQDKNREELVRNMKKRVEDCSRQSSQNYSLPTIYKVPLTLRQCDKAAYQPQFISIGPYYRRSGGKKRLRAMERHKWQYLHDFLRRNPCRSFDDYFKEVEKLEERARRCYSEEILLNRLELTEVMVLDGCFVIELFLKHWEGRAKKAMDAKEYYDPIYSHLCVKFGVARDLLLLENQLPFFILDSLYGTLSVSTPSMVSMVEIALNFFSSLKGWNWRMRTVVPEHLLHLVHFHLFSPLNIPAIAPPPTSSTSGTTGLIKSIWECCLKHYLMQKLKNLLLFSCDFSLSRARKTKLDPTHSRPWPKPFTGTIPSATRLKDAGVTFSEQKVPKSPLDITFNISSGKLEIPYLCVDDGINSLFRNLAAFEQYVPSAGVQFSSYLSFMDDIVNTAQDVEILRSHGIIENVLGSDEEIALLFNRMCTGIITGGGAKDQIWQVMKDAKVYSETKRHAQMAMLMRDYFGSPWSFISVMAAAFLILLTLLQTIFAFLSYFKASS